MVSRGVKICQAAMDRTRTNRSFLKILSIEIIPYKVFEVEAIFVPARFSMIYFVRRLEFRIMINYGLNLLT